MQKDETGSEHAEQYSDPSISFRAHFHFLFVMKPQSLFHMEILSTDTCPYLYIDCRHQRGTSGFKASRHFLLPPKD